MGRHIILGLGEYFYLLTDCAYSTTVARLADFATYVI
jgi:hypothetical protein